MKEKLKYDEISGFKFGFRLFGRPKMVAYIYFVDGLLIDTGQSKVRNKILSETSALNIEQIFITHHHEDHTGNIRPLKEKHQCKVYGSEKCSRIMKNPPKLSAVQKLTWGNREPYCDVIPLNNVVKTRNYSFNIIPVPGHAPDMAALYEPDKQWLFSADLFINDYIGYFLADESIEEEIESTRKILQLDFKVMFCSHNPQIKNAKQQLSKKLDFLEASFDKVASLHRKEYSTTEIFKELELKENWFVKTLSGGYLSKFNMVKSIVRDIEKK